MERSKCVKCQEPLVLWRDSCGTGYSWSLYKCSHCGQLMAEGYVPKEAREDPEIVILSLGSSGAALKWARRKVSDG